MKKVLMSIMGSALIVLCAEGTALAISVDPFFAGVYSFSDLG